LQLQSAAASEVHAEILLLFKHYKKESKKPEGGQGE
jgi:hypothetical protein